MSTIPDPQTPEPAAAWWRFPMMWLVVGGPLIVVAASFTTLAMAIRHPDPVLDTSTAAARSQQPAVQARNHAATPAR